MKKAVVLAAGRGTRMGDLTEEIPKPMLPLGGKPLIEHILGRLSAAGFSEFLLVTGYRAEVIENHLTQYPRPITFRRQATINGTAKAVLLARDFVGADPFLLTFGDIVTEPADYQGLRDLLFSDAKTEGTLGVKFADDPWQGAAVYEQNGLVTRIVEKPAKGTSTTNWNSAGLYTFRPTIFDYLERVAPSPRGEYEVTSAIADMISDRKFLKLYEVKGSWRDVGRPEDLEIAAELVKPKTDQR